MSEVDNTNIFVSELYEISPYAQFAIGFRTFGHVDNQEVPSRMHVPSNSKLRYDSGKFLIYNIGITLRSCVTD